MNIFERLSNLSQISGYSFLAITNAIDGNWEFFVVREWKVKTNLNPYNELIGENITSYVTGVSINGIDLDVFNTKLMNIPVSQITFNHDNWINIVSVIPKM